VTPARWLIDKSALTRVHRSPVDRSVTPRIVAGLVGVSIVSELEMGYSARSTADYAISRASLLNLLIAVPLSFRAEDRAREVQARLVERGQHRAVGVPDLLIAATAEVEGLTVLHYDADFDLIADVTDQPTEWIAPRGSV